MEHWPTAQPETSSTASRLEAYLRGLPRQTKLRLITAALALVLGGANAVAQESSAVPSPYEQAGSFEEVTEAYLNKMSEAIAREISGDPKAVLELLDSLHQSAGNPEIVLHKLTGIRSFEAGPANRLMLDRSSTTYDWDQPDPNRMLEEYLAELSHAIQFQEAPLKTMSAAALTYGVALVKTLDDIRTKGGCEGESLLECLQTNYTEFAYQTQSKLLGYLEQRAHAGQLSEQTQKVRIIGENAPTPDYGYLVKDEDGNLVESTEGIEVQLIIFLRNALSELARQANEDN